jgi:hypothetical protein
MAIGKTYFVARYLYNDSCKGIAASTDVDCLPPTCLSPIRRIVASNKRDAVRQFKACQDPKNCGGIALCPACDLGPQRTP